MRQVGVRASCVGIAATLLLLVPGVAAAQEGDRDCSDFSSQEEAQRFFEQEGGPERDPHDLDRDNDGFACEEFDYGGSVASAGTAQYPRGGIETGHGSSASDGVGTTALIAGGGALLALTGGVGFAAFRRRLAG